MPLSGRQPLSGVQGAAHYMEGVHQLARAKQLLRRGLDTVNPPITVTSSSSCQPRGRQAR